MSPALYFLRAVKKAFLACFQRSTVSVPAAATAWESMVTAASEEWVDETVFRFTVKLPAHASYRELADSILETGRKHPDLATLQKQLAAKFSITEKEALRAIDRALGGVVRAATLNPHACPDAAIDPVAAAAFALALEDPAIIDSIFPGWREWEPSVHPVSS
jgi:hypothetical protein